MSAKNAELKKTNLVKEECCRARWGLCGLLLNGGGTERLLEVIL
jgi:hypothetical protein